MCGVKETMQLDQACLNSSPLPLVIQALFAPFDMPKLIGVVGAQVCCQP
jgi:hypothetical protein